MNTKVYWFRHDHENRNDLLRLGLMRLHFSGQINYIERDFSAAEDYGFSKSVLAYPDLRHKSFLLFQEGKHKVKCLIDNEDSFVLFNSLITEVDVYFCAGYNSDVFERSNFVKPYMWQNDADLRWYKETLIPKIEKYNGHFHKVRKFIPIAPNLTYQVNNSWLKQKFRSLEYHSLKLLKLGYALNDDYMAIEIRYDYLLKLRNNNISYDIVLNDTLWGWPKHRINLHTELLRLNNQGYNIHSILKKADLNTDYNTTSMTNLEFPIRTRPINNNYEVMLSQSRLGVFACGFHWGWRNILTLSLMIGIPVVTDKLLTEAYFDLKQFTFWEIEDHTWKAVEGFLRVIDEATWIKIKQENQKVYDQYLSPDAVAQYFIKTISSS